MNALRSPARRTVLMAGGAAAALPALGQAAMAGGPSRAELVLSGRVRDARGQVVRGGRLQMPQGLVALTDGDGRFFWRGPMPLNQALRCELSSAAGACPIEADLAAGLAGPGVSGMTRVRDPEGTWRVTLDIRLS